MKTYPINLVLTNRLVVLFGAKGEIVHKIDGLLDVGAYVRYIAPTADNEVKRRAALGEIEWQPRSYREGDLAGAAMVIACTNNDAVHDQIWAEGQRNGQLVNVMDVLPQCNFHAASLVRRDQLTISIGTSGAAPALAVRIREKLEAEMGQEYSRFLQLARSLRKPLAQRFPSFGKRRKRWYELVDSDVIPLLKQGRELTACTRMVEIMGTAPCESHNGACQVVDGPLCADECPIARQIGLGQTQSRQTQSRQTQSRQTQPHQIA